VQDVTIQIGYFLVCVVDVVLQNMDQFPAQKLPHLFTAAIKIKPQILLMSQRGAETLLDV
jgi:hypothetical protein